MKVMFGFLFLLLFQFSCAQVSTPVVNDSVPPGPNAIRIKATVVTSTAVKATLKIVSVLESGQGIINPLYENQEITVEVSAPKVKLKGGKIIVADVKEKLGVDNSQSSYVLISVLE
jgi:hypothetical protein